MVLVLKIFPEYLLYLARPNRSISNLVKTLYKCGENSKAVFVVKPSVVPVWLYSRRIANIAIPPSSIVVDYSVLETCNIEEPDYRVAEEVWIDGKSFPLTEDISRKRENCLLVDTLEEVFGSLSESGRCYVVCEYEMRELLKILLNPVVSDLSTLREVDRVRVEGFISTFWSTHPVLYGLRLDSKMDLEVVNIDKTLLRHYVKTLAFLDRYVLLSEVPYSNSILFTGYSRELLEAAVRAVLYSC